MAIRVNVLYVIVKDVEKNCFMTFLNFNAAIPGCSYSG